MKVKFLKDLEGIYNLKYEKDSIKTISPYTYHYRNWSKNNNDTFTINELNHLSFGKDAVVVCYGQGMFDYWIIDEDVEIV